MHRDKYFVLKMKFHGRKLELWLCNNGIRDYQLKNLRANQKPKKGRTSGAIDKNHMLGMK